MLFVSLLLTRKCSRSQEVRPAQENPTQKTQISSHHILLYEISIQMTLRRRSDPPSQPIRNIRSIAMRATPLPQISRRIHRTGIVRARGAVVFCCAGAGGCAQPIPSHHVSQLYCCVFCRNGTYVCFSPSPSAVPAVPSLTICLIMEFGHGFWGCSLLQLPLPLCVCMRPGL